MKKLVTATLSILMALAAMALPTPVGPNSASAKPLDPNCVFHGAIEMPDGPCTDITNAYTTDGLGNQADQSASAQGTSSYTQAYASVYCSNTYFLTVKTFATDGPSPSAGVTIFVGVDQVVRSVNGSVTYPDYNPYCDAYGS
jgi:hypothetical protein